VKDSEVLAAAAEWIAQGFAKDGYAINSAGGRVDIMSEFAATFCLVGGVARAGGGSIRAADVIVDKWVQPLLPIRYVAVGGADGYSIVQKAPPTREKRASAREWNDEPERSQAQVVSMLKQAASAAEKAGE
jgi:hypothetical protein